MESCVDQLINDLFFCDCMLFLHILCALVSLSCHGILQPGVFGILDYGLLLFIVFDRSQILDSNTTLRMR